MSRIRCGIYFKFILFSLLTLLFLTGFISKKQPQKVSVVMEYYPPQSFFSPVPQKVSTQDFNGLILNRLSGKDKTFLLSIYHLNSRLKQYELKKKIKESQLEKIKNLLISTGFLKAVGIEVEITREIFSQMGLKPEYREYPWIRCLETVKTGNSDVVLAVVKTRQREQFLYYPSEPTVFETNSLFKLKTSKITANGNLQSLKKYTIAATSGASYGEKFDKAGFLKKERVSSAESIIRLVENKRVDLGVGSVQTVTYLMNKMGLSNKLVFLKPPLGNEPLFAAFSRTKSHQKMAEEFSDRLAKFKKTKKYRAILAKYGV